MNVRPIEPRDFKSVAGLLQRTIRGRGHTTADGLLNNQSTAHWIGLCCVEADELLGAIVGQCVVDEAEIHEVAVAHEARRKGCGTKLVEAFTTSVHQRGAHQCSLEVRAGNLPAIALYKSMGFQNCATRRAYYADGEDAIVMIRSLEPLH